MVTSSVHTSTVEVRHTGEGVEFVAADGDPHAHTFAGWLEVLQKLEPRS